MAIIVSSELGEANTAVAGISKYAEKSKELQNQIENFLNDFDNKLEGDLAQALKSKWLTNKDALEKFITINNNLSSSATSANNEMLNYLGKNITRIDDQFKSEIETMIAHIDYDLSNIEKNVKAEDDVTNIDAIKNKRDRYVQILEKINNLESVANSAYSKIEPVAEDILNFCSALKGSTAGWKNTFFNLGGRNIIYFAQTGYYKDGVRYEWKSNWLSAGGQPIFNSGCGPTSLAMVIATILQDPSITPAVVADIMDENNWKNDSKKFVFGVSDKYNLNCQSDVNFDGDTIEAVIKAGGAFMRVNYDDKLGGSHFKAVTDVVYIDGQRYFILCDPWPKNLNEPGEPELATEQEVCGFYSGTNYFITPSNVEINYNPENKTIESLTDANNNEVVWEKN